MRADEIEVGKLYKVEFFGIGKARIVKIERVKGKPAKLRMRWVDPPDHDRARHGTEFSTDTRNVYEPA